MDEDDGGNLPTLPRDGIYMTPYGKAALEAEYEAARTERHRVVGIVSWAAGNGDRSENADYKEGKRRLREIDRRLRYLGQRLAQAEVIDPSAQSQCDRVFFGATVTCLDERDEEVTVTIVGVDEADVGMGKISIGSPMALAMLKERIGDEVTVWAPGGPSTVGIVGVRYPTRG